MNLRLLLPILIPMLTAFRPRCDITLRGAVRWLWALPGTPHEVAMGVAVGMFLLLALLYGVRSAPRVIVPTPVPVTTSPVTTSPAGQ